MNLLLTCVCLLCTTTNTYTLGGSTIGSKSFTILPSFKECISSNKKSSVVLFNEFEGCTFSVINESGDVIEYARNDTTVFGFSFYKYQNCFLVISHDGKDSKQRSFSLSYRAEKCEKMWLTNQNITFNTNDYDFSDNCFAAVTQYHVSFFYFGIVKNTLDVKLKDFQVILVNGMINGPSGKLDDIGGVINKDYQYNSQAEVYASKETTAINMNSKLSGEVSFYCDYTPNLPIAGMLAEGKSGFITVNDIIGKKDKSKAKKTNLILIIAVICSVVIIIPIMVFFYIKFIKKPKDNTNTEQLEINFV